MNVTDIRALGNLQTNYMWLATFGAFPTMPANAVTSVGGDFESAGSGSSFTLQTRESTVPGKAKATQNFRFLNRQISMVQGTSHEGEWTATLVMAENSALYKNMVKWFYAMDYAPNSTALRSNMYIGLLSLDGSKINSRYCLVNAYPKAIPNLEGLNQENTEGYIDMAIQFAFDNIVPDLSYAYQSAEATPVNIQFVVAQPHQNQFPTDLVNI